MSERRDGGRDPSPTVAIVMTTSDRFHSRVHRMAGSLSELGYRVVVLSRHEPGDQESEERGAWRVVRVPMPIALESVRHAGIAGGPGKRREVRHAVPSPLKAAFRRFLNWLPREIRAPALAARFVPVAPRADVWHAVGLLALPVALRLASRLGGRVVYDSVEIQLEAGGYMGYSAIVRGVLARFERRWAHRADALVTVGTPFAQELERRLGRRPTIVWNAPPRGVPVVERPLRQTLGVGADDPIVLYHGRVTADRGIEQLIAAMPHVPGAVLVVLGYGALLESVQALAQQSAAADRIHFLDAVPPGDLISWVSRADVCAMPIQGTTLNHRLATPNKLFEAIGAGVPVVVSDLPGMAPIVREHGVGETCDPTDPADVARAIRAIIELPAHERAALRQRCLDVAREHFNWEAQAERLVTLYASLGASPRVQNP